MQYILYLLCLLACPVGMDLMMWWMMRGNNEQAPFDEEIVASRLLHNDGCLHVEVELTMVSKGPCCGELEAERCARTHRVAGA